MDAPSFTPPVKSGIDIRKLKEGTIILLEAEPYLYEMRVVYPIHNIVEISSNNPGLRLATVGELLTSRIGKGSALEIRFRNGTYRTQPVTAVGIKETRGDGSRWSYDVF